MNERPPLYHGRSELGESCGFVWRSSTDIVFRCVIRNSGKYCLSACTTQVLILLQLASTDSRDWVKISEMFLGKSPEDFNFIPKHKSNSYGGGRDDGEDNQG